MKLVTRALMLLVVLAAIWTTIACAGGPGRSAVSVRTAPPPAIYESRGIAPGPGYYWAPGYQRWTGNTYIWAPGRWDRIPPGRRSWAPGHWGHNRRGYYWIDGRWR